MGTVNSTNIVQKQFTGQCGQFTRVTDPGRALLGYLEALRGATLMVLLRRPAKKREITDRGIVHYSFSRNAIRVRRGICSKSSYP